MRPKVSEARDRLVKALTALENPQAYCKQEGYGDVKDLSNAQAYAVGGAKALIEFALHSLGEPIDPFRSRDTPYVRPTERERIEMCGPDPVRNEELGL